MSAHNAPFESFSQAVELVDPGASGTISVNRTPCVVKLISAAAETRTLARPTRVGAQVTLQFKTDGGDITLTVTGGYNTNGDTTYTFSAVGQFVQFVSIEYGGTYYWRKVADYNDGNNTPTRLVSLTTTPVTITAASHANRTIVLNKADALACTLPAATGTGNVYTFIVGTTASGGSYTIVRAGSDVIKGTAFGDDGDGEPANGWSTTNATTITMDGSTQGGVAGDTVILTDIASAVWAVRAHLTQTGTEATPFS
jgi:hypothetical protein